MIYNTLIFRQNASSNQKIACVRLELGHAAVDRNIYISKQHQYAGNLHLVLIVEYFAF